MISRDIFKDFFINQIKSIDLSNCEYISLAGSLVSDNLISGWSDIDIVLISKSLDSKFLIDISKIEKVCSDYFGIKVGIEIIEKDIFLNAIKNIDSLYLKYYKHIIGGLKESCLLYRDNNLDISKYFIKEEALYALNPLNGIYFIQESLIKYIKSKPDDYFGYQRKMFKNIFYIYQLYCLSCENIYKKDNKELLDKYSILRYIENKKAFWENYNEDHIDDLEKVIQELLKLILLKS